MNIRTGIHDVQNDNICSLVYTLEIEINLLDFNSKYPENPQTVGEKLRKARMDKGMTLKEVAALFGVSDTAVINWEIRGKMPEEGKMDKVKEFIASCSAADFT
ncbi:MAG: helix-turn-helix transcriptional regulator [Candidatus Omnitrophota bacterium]